MALRRRPNGRPGAPSMLTEETKKTLVDASARGVPIRIAAQLAGIGETTFTRWCQRGRDVQERVEYAEAEGREVEIDELDLPYYEFWLDIEDARARAVAHSVLTLQKAATGGFVTKEVTRRFRDSVTGQIVEETTTDTAPPDWRASAWMLERGPARQMFQKDPTHVELSGVDGGPIEIATGAETLAERVRANMLAAQAAQAAITAGDEDDGTVDGEVVEE